MVNLRKLFAAVSWQLDDTNRPHTPTPAHPNPPQLPRDRRFLWSDDYQPAPIWTAADNAARPARAAARHHELGCSETYCLQCRRSTNGDDQRALATRVATCTGNTTHDD